MDKKSVRCAIYTRKSSEEGLEQDFNSLDAQREACESFIKSQKHEGWQLIEKQYNDGGFSGGTMNRPAFKELLKDIENNEIDIVVVYKVDRLTRSLMDFSKIIDIFDKHETSFVSITQQFNTTTSMGRLTLNILLSFAQFEREVTSERIRDKIAASKKKGMWVCGCIPIGYEKIDKKLVIKDNDSQKVKLIFEKYLELKSVAKLKDYLDRQQIKTRKNKYFSQGQLYHLLSNKVYIGKIVHKKQVYDGTHCPIIENELFEQVQNLLYENKIDKLCKTKSSSNSLLIGLIYDYKKNKMTPSHSYSRKKKYRYYVTSGKNRYDQKIKIPAEEIEKFVINEIKILLQDEVKLQNIFANMDISKQITLINIAKNIADYSEHKLVRCLISKVKVSKDNIEIEFNESAIIPTLESISRGESLKPTIDNKNIETFVISKNIKFSQPSNSGKILILKADEKNKQEPNPYLLNALAKCYYYHQQIKVGKTIADLQQEENLKDSKYIRNLLNLKYISPSLIEQIFNGTQPKELSLQRLIKTTCY